MSGQDKPSRLEAFIKLLELVSMRSAKAITYTTALLGIVALSPNIRLPLELEVLAGSLGVNMLANILDHIAYNDRNSEEILDMVEQAIANSGIEKLLTKDRFLDAYSQLMDSQRDLASASDEILMLLRRYEEKLYPVSSGIKYTEVRQIAQDVFDANMYRLAGDASDLAKQRVNELIDGFLKDLIKSNPVGINSASDPDFQYVLLLSQLAYARSGDKDMLDVLLNTLVERAASTKHTFLRVIQDEAFNVISKLTVDQYNALSLLFLVQQLGLLNARSIDVYISDFRKYIWPVLKEKMPDTPMAYRFMEDQGCISEESIIKEKEHKEGPLRGDLFEQSLTKQEIDFLVTEGKVRFEFFMPKPYGKNEFILMHTKRKTHSVRGERGVFIDIFEPFPDEESVYTLLKSNNLSTGEIEIAIRQYRFLSSGSSRGVSGLLADVEPRINKWRSMENFLTTYHLTPVGLVVAIANLKRLTGENYNILNWIK